MAIKDKNTLKLDLDVAFPDNTTGLITPEILRTYIIDLIESQLNQTVHDLGETGIVNFSRNIKEIFTKATAGTINPGEAVFIAGPTQVELADSTFFTGYAVGVALETITDAVGGEVLVFGEYTGIDTSLIPTGTRLYLGATPGELVTTFPDAGEKGQVIGTTIKQAVSGTIFVNPSESLNTDSKLAYLDPTGLTNVTTLNVQEAIAELDAAIPSAGVSRYGSMHSTAVQQMAAVISDQQINFGAVDAQSNVTADTANNRFTIDSDGAYYVHLDVHYTYDVQNIGLRVKVNGVTQIDLGRGVFFGADQGLQGEHQGSCGVGQILNLVANDQVTFFLYKRSTAGGDDPMASAHASIMSMTGGQFQSGAQLLNGTINPTGVIGMTMTSILILLLTLCLVLR